MSWVDHVARLRAERRASVLVTVTAVRGHAPREAGAKMIVAGADTYGSIGGGNLEMTAVARARELLASRAREPEILEFRLNDRARTEHGRQCCGGEVSILLEPLAVAPSVAIFGVGHVGLELARVLSRHELDLFLTDSRPEQIEEAGQLEAGEATIRSRHAVLGEQVLSELPAGCHVLIMTHDHAEDLHLCDAALRRDDLGSIGLIGSSAKWQRFRKNLTEAGFAPDLVDTIACPIGLPDLPGKDPATIAVGVAADLLRRIRTGAPTS